MDLDSLDLFLAVDLFVMLLIGIGPKIALVPFLELTGGMSAEEQKKVATRMIRNALVVALVLIVLGKFLMQLLHFTPGALSLAGGLILLILALYMTFNPGELETHKEQSEGRDLMSLAAYPLAVPLLLNPAGIVSLVTLSGEIDSFLTLGAVIIILLLVIAIDWLVFRNINVLSKHLDPLRLLVTEKVFGILLAALAIQLMLDGMADLNLIDMIAH
jgi:multiple antibiotic resistance protein